MTTFDLSRVAEGLCPNTAHGELDRLDDGYGRCHSCEVDWRVRGHVVTARDLLMTILPSGFELEYVGASVTNTTEANETGGTA